MRSLVTFFLIATLRHRTTSRRIDSGDFEQNESSKSRELKNTALRLAARVEMLKVEYAVHPIQTDFPSSQNIVPCTEIGRRLNEI